MIAFTSSPPGNAQINSTSYTVTAVSSSSLPVTFSIDPSSSAVCTIVGSIVSFNLTAGVCRVNANSGATADHSTPAQVFQTFGVGLTPQTITITSAQPAAPVTGGR